MSFSGMLSSILTADEDVTTTSVTVLQLMPLVLDTEIGLFLILLLTNSMLVDADTSLTDDMVCDAVKTAGYGAEPAGKSDSAINDRVNMLKNTESLKLARRLSVSICLLIPLI